MSVNGDGTDAADGVPAAGRPPRRRPVRSFALRQRDEIVRDVLIGLFLLLGAVVWDNALADRADEIEERRAAHQEQLDDQRAERDEVLENTRFVRQVSVEGRARPFNGLNLRGAHLAGLDLRCLEDSAVAATREDRGCALLGGADLTGANLTGTLLDGADLRGARLADATLVGTSFVGADLGGADLDGACFDGTTQWPDGFAAPATTC